MSPYSSLPPVSSKVSCLFLSAYNVTTKDHIIRCDYNRGHACFCPFHANRDVVCTNEIFGPPSLPPPPRVCRQQRCLNRPLLLSPGSIWYGSGEQRRGPQVVQQHIPRTQRSGPFKGPCLCHPPISFLLLQREPVSLDKDRMSFVYFLIIAREILILKLSIFIAQ